MLGILNRTKQNEGRAGEIYYEYEVDRHMSDEHVPLDAALSTLEIDLESLWENARENGLI